MSADILIYGIVAAGLVFWLRSVLGTRHGDERQRGNPFAAPAAEPVKKTPLNAGTQGTELRPGEPADMKAGLARNMSIENEGAERGLREVARALPSFDLPHFLGGAQDAFTLIIESFAAGDKETLKGLLSEPVYRAFAGVIDERARKGEKGSVEIHAIRKCEVVQAWIADKTAFVTVRFTADETSIVRDSDGLVIFGDPERITETIDLWTFSHPLRSRDPVWLLQETREDENDTLSGSTVPDAKSDTAQENGIH